MLSMLNTYPIHNAKRAAADERSNAIRTQERATMFDLSSLISHANETDSDYEGVYPNRLYLNEGIYEDMVATNGGKVYRNNGQDFQIKEAATFTAEEIVGMMTKTNDELEILFLSELIGGPDLYHDVRLLADLLAGDDVGIHPATGDYVPNIDRTAELEVLDNNKPYGHPFRHSLHVVESRTSNGNGGSVVFEERDYDGNLDDGRMYQTVTDPERNGGLDGTTFEEGGDVIDAALALNAFRAFLADLDKTMRRYITA
jgi:hypothetical protein